MMQVREKISRARKASEVCFCSIPLHEIVLFVDLNISGDRKTECNPNNEWQLSSVMEEDVLQKEKAAAQGAAAVHHRASG